MKTFCISCPELPERRSTAEKHFQAMGVEATFIDGIHADTFGILSWKPYEHDYPGRGHLIPTSQVGLFLSHYMVYQVCLHLPESTFLILEDDAKFPDGWSSRFEKAMEDVPGDWDIVLVGSSNCADKPCDQIKNEIWEIKYPFCTHAMMIHKKALPVMLRELRGAPMQIDLALILHVYPKLKVYTIWPRIVGQRGMDLMK